MNKLTRCSIIIGIFLIPYVALYVDLDQNNIASSEILHSSSSEHFFNGTYDGDLAITYYEFDSLGNAWFYQNSSTHLIEHNATISEREYQLEKIEVWTDNLINESGRSEYSVASNISRQISLNPAYAFAQEFTAPSLMGIEEIKIYVNYTIPFILDKGYYYLILRIFDENFAEEIDSMHLYMEELTVDRWLSFYPYTNIFESGNKYNLVFYPWADEEDFNYIQSLWKAENKSSSIYDEGITRYYNGANWIRIPLDHKIDLMCNFTYIPLYHPSEFDIKFTINGEFVDPVYQKSSWGFLGYEAYTSFTFYSKLDDFANLTITTNQTIATLNVYVEMYYIYLINATGSYKVNDNIFEWTIDYDYEELSFGWPPPVFLFERDWSFQEFIDPYGQKMTQIYFGPISIYNISYYGITDFFGPPLERGTYTGMFSSPNYCNTIKMHAKSGSVLVEKSALELGQEIVIEAQITNTYNQPLSGGNGQIMLIDSKGNLIHNQTAIPSINGFLTSSEISIGTNHPEGLYEALIFWTNGKELAYYSIMIEVRDPTKIYFYIAIFSIIAVAATPIALVLRRQIKQKNWEKSLKNLFVLTKDGVSLYEYSFGIEIQDPTLISAMIAALTNFVREATGSKKALRTVDQEDKKVILYHGNYITAALLSEKDLPIIHKRIMKFTQDFEEKYGKALKSWKGDTSMFKGSEVIINQYFPLDVEGQIIRGVRQKLIEFRERLEYLNQPEHIITMMREITEFISRDRHIVNLYYIDYYNEIIYIAEKKIST